MSSRTFDLAILGLGVATVSTAAVLIREAEAPALVIAAYRLGFASLPLALLVGGRRTKLPKPARALGLSFLAGSFLAIHFGFWIASVQQTSIVTSVALVTLQPVFVALVSGPLLREWPSRAVWTGILIAALGALIMIIDDRGASGDTLRGDFFALLGAVFGAAYILTGRSIRSSGISWRSYVSAAYSTSAIVLLVAAIVGGESLTGYSGRTYLFFVLLALVPQLVGHTALNRSLGYLSAATVAVAILGEPIGASILATVFLDEQPTILEGLGGLVLLVGVYAAVRPSIRMSAATSGQGAG